VGGTRGPLRRDLARQRLLEYRRPGNVRELRNILERAAILCDGGLITPEHPAFTASAPSIVPPARELAPAAALAAAARPSSAGELQTMERAMIEQALREARFNTSRVKP
jgi:two-component system, NtrC family, response regulator HydG